MLVVRSRLGEEMRRGNGDADGENPVGTRGFMFVGEGAGDALLESRTEGVERW